MSACLRIRHCTWPHTVCSCTCPCVRPCVCRYQHIAVAALICLRVHAEEARGSPGEWARVAGQDPAQRKSNHFITIAVPEVTLLCSVEQAKQCNQ
eukprot:1154264-Pelagomonas_calceolata.AAC.6